MIEKKRRNTQRAGMIGTEEIHKERECLIEKKRRNTQRAGMIDREEKKKYTKSGNA